MISDKHNILKELLKGCLESKSHLTFETFETGSPSPETLEIRKMS